MVDTQPVSVRRFFFLCCDMAAVDHIRIQSCNKLINDKVQEFSHQLSEKD